MSKFAALGFDSYRLVPGLDVLVPFDPAATHDGYLLNLFCCKPDRAAALSDRGLLLDAASLAAFGRRIASNDFAQHTSSTVGRTRAGDAPLRYRICASLGVVAG